MVDMIGAWELISSINYKNGEGSPSFGDPPSGQLQYTADGRMGGFLQDPDWVQKGSPEAKGFSDFFAYGGTWKREGNEVTHQVLFASSPQRVGTEFTRFIEVIDDNNVRLVTAEETSKSGAKYITKLHWRRVAS